MELLYASVDPIISLVHSFVYQLCSQPNLQEKIYSQLHDLTPCMLALESRASLPLVEACVYELLRFKSPLPLGIFRRTLGPFTLVNFNNTVIPQHAVVVANLWKMHHDESVYEEAHKFRPERFLNGEGHLSESMVRSLFVFGAGKRICPGKRVVFDLLFMYVGNLVREFKFRFERENSPLSGIVCERRIVTSVDECDDRRKSESEIKTLCTDRDSLLKCIQDGDLVYDDDNCS
jgi:cytochrome P450